MKIIGDLSSFDGGTYPQLSSSVELFTSDKTKKQRFLQKLTFIILKQKVVIRQRYECLINVVYNANVIRAVRV